MRNSSGPRKEIKETMGMRTPEKPSGERAMATVRRLSGMGIRFAGTDAERRAAGWISDQFLALGLRNVQIQEFPCKTFSVSGFSVQARTGSGWKALPAEPAAHSRSTRTGGLEAKLIRVEKIPSSVEACRRLFGGRIPLLYCSEFFQFRLFQKVLEAGPRAILLVDDRFPNDWTVAVGFPRYWIDFIDCPILNIPYSAAWELMALKVSDIRVELKADVADALSQNVLAEIPGNAIPDEVIVISGHHDSVINNPGADDNCTGVAAVLELARIFVKTGPKRTLRFISYGAEEQLSEGALYYAAHASDRSRIQFVLNADAIGACMGKTGIYYSGWQQLAKTLRAVSSSTGVAAHLFRELSPFSDHFPLNLAGIPCAWYYRTTYAGGRHFHHSRLETCDVISVEVLSDVLRHQAVLLDTVANALPLPFPPGIPGSARKQLRSMAKDWCGPRELVEKLLED